MMPEEVSHPGDIQPGDILNISHCEVRPASRHNSIGAAISHLATGNNLAGAPWRLVLLSNAIAAAFL
jgi:hypothetical protein